MWSPPSVVAFCLWLSFVSCSLFLGLLFLVRGCLWSLSWRFRALPFDLSFGSWSRSPLSFSRRLRCPLLRCFCAPHSASVCLPSGLSCLFFLSLSRRPFGFPVSRRLSRVLGRCSLFGVSLCLCPCSLPVPLSGSLWPLSVICCLALVLALGPAPCCRSALPAGRCRCARVPASRCRVPVSRCSLLSVDVYLT